MKTVDRFFHRYILSSIGILLLFFAINIIFAILFLFIFYLSGAKDSTFQMEQLSELIENHDGSLIADPQAANILTEENAWAMLLDKEGTVVWQNSLPEEIPLQYSISDVALFSRWYLKGYPINIWSRPDGLLVVGFQPNMVFQYYSSVKIKYYWLLLFYILAALLINICFMIFLFLRNTRKVENAMRPILAGIQKLSKGEPFHLEEKGELAELNTSLNHASACLAKKDNTRAEWIRGISHDIRTPLSMILGYSSEMEDNPKLPAPSRKQAGIIRKQGERLRALIADLNLTTKLEYSMQPIRRQALDPLELVRQVISEQLNHGLPEIYELEFSEFNANPSILLCGDSSLLSRMLHNLIQNSMAHNLGGCKICVSVGIENGNCIFDVTDTGSGMNEAYLDLLNNNVDIPSSLARSNEIEHGLGLKIVRQIVRAHKGKIHFENVLPHGLKVEIVLPLSSKEL